MAKKENIDKQAGSGLVITRVFDAPRELVWKAWTDPEHFKRWWGPKKFTTPVNRMDFRVGGKYLNCMRSPEGQEYWSTGVYREIVPPERLVLTDSFSDDEGNVVPASHYGMHGDWPPELLVTVTLEDAGGRTRMTLQHVGIPEGVMREQTETGWNESFDKLAESLATPVPGFGFIAEPGKQDIIVTRVFAAPRAVLFKAYTDPELVPQWWGPGRYTTAIDKMDVRPGGAWRYVQCDHSGNEYGFHGVYHEVASDRIIATFEFEGAPGHVSLDTAIFEEQDGKTKLTIKSVFQSVVDRDAMLSAGMKEGLAETLDRLAELLARPDLLRKAA